MPKYSRKTLSVAAFITAKGEAFSLETLLKLCNGDMATLREVRAYLGMRGWTAPAVCGEPDLKLIYYPPIYYGAGRLPRLAEQRLHPEVLEEALRKMYAVCGCVKGYGWTP